MKQRFHFVHFVLAEDEGDDQNTHRPSGRLELLADSCRAVSNHVSTGGIRFADA
jgi:hypothetical protein